MNAIGKVVFSHTLEKAEWKNTRLVSTDAVREVAHLRQQAGKDMLIFGSAELSSTLMEHGLIDEYRIGLTPIVLGAGTPLFKPSPKQTKMTLLEARPFESGFVILRYSPEPST
jgi:dihydrofolate reductase